MNKPDIRPDHLKMVQDILNKSLSSDVKVWVYGSRAKWTTLDSSDLDLALEGKDKIDYEVINCLNRDFEESNLPYEVDVVDINTVQPFFRDIINKDKVLLDRYTLVKEKKTSPKGWREVKLGDLCADISYGYTASAKHDSVGPKFLRITDIISDQINWNNVPYCEISEDKKKNYQLETGDIVIARTGANTGYNKIIKTNHTAIFASYLIRYKINHSLAYPFYINYVLKSLYWKNFVKSIVSGSAQPGANAKQFASFTFLLPSLSEQKAIAEILSSLDNKIEQNQNMNKILEDMAQSIFKSWFIDFDPVHAKKMALEAGLAEGQAERAAMAVIAGVCSPKQFAENFRQMDRSLGEKFSKINESAKYELIYKASLFPSEFVDSKLGLIPKGWNICKIGEKIDFNPTTHLKKGTIANYVDMKSLPTSGHRIKQFVKRIFKSGTKFQNGDTLIARITPFLENGKTAYVDCLKHKEVAWGSTEFIVMRPQKDVFSIWTYLLSRNEDFRRFAISNMSGTSGRTKSFSRCFISI